MKRITILPVAAAFLLCFSTSAIATTPAPKAGAACGKINQVISAGGSKLSCVKQGKKLVWRKVDMAQTAMPIVPTPAPVTSAAPIATPVDPLAPCKLPVADGRGDVAIGGWPRIPQRMKSIGTVISQVIMVDFPDAPATMTTQAAFAKIAGATDTFKEMSYGKFNYVMQPTAKWYRMSKKSSDYVSGGWTFDTQKAYILEATAIADNDVDFSKSDSFIILANPDAVGMGTQGPAFTPLAHDGITLDGRYFGNGATSAYDLNHWGSIWANHELTHTLGMIDLYTFNQAANGNLPFPFTGDFSYMGDSSFDSNSPGLLAFERWNIGWLDDSQMICDSQSEITQTLTPVENSGGVKALIVPISRTKALVVESRRPIGIDKNLVKSGALVYLVDSSIQSGMGPVKVFPANLAADPKYTQAPRALGESVTVEGITVTVIASDAQSDTIHVTKS
jgi:M6 family metalloprotease-like protein